MILFYALTVLAGIGGVGVGIALTVWLVATERIIIRVKR